MLETIDLRFAGSSMKEIAIEPNAIVGLELEANQIWTDDEPSIPTGKYDHTVEIVYVENNSWIRGIKTEELAKEVMNKIREIVNKK
jgi:hypothetical protein